MFKIFLCRLILSDENNAKSSADNRSSSDEKPKVHEDTNEKDKKHSENDDTKENPKLKTALEAEDKEAGDTGSGMQESENGSGYTAQIDVKDDDLANKKINSKK